MFIGQPENKTIYIFVYKLKCYVFFFGTFIKKIIKSTKLLLLCKGVHLNKINVSGEIKSVNLMTRSMIIKFGHLLTHFGTYLSINCYQPLLLVLKKFICTLVSVNSLQSCWSEDLKWLKF